MKISISGPQCCGKSTVLNAMQQYKAFEGYNFIDEPVRRLVREKGIKINQDSTFDDQYLILQEHHLNLLKNGSRNFATDRSAFDAFSYATYDYIHGKYDFKQWKSFKEIFDECMKMYDSIFILEPLPLKDDNFRSLDLTWQLETYDVMLNVANEYVKDSRRDIFSYLPVFSVEQRMAVIQGATYDYR